MPNKMHASATKSSTRKTALNAKHAKKCTLVVQSVITILLNSRKENASHAKKDGT